MDKYGCVIYGFNFFIGYIVVLKKQNYHEPFHRIIQYYIHWIPKPFRPLLVKKVLKIEGDVYDNVFSVGADCTGAETLRAVSLRKFSSPFDWVSGVNLVSRLDFLLNDLDGMMDKKDIVIHHELSDTAINTYKTVNLKTGMEFPHDFVDVNKEKSFPIVVEKYNRRFERIKKRMKGSNNLLVYMKEFNDDFDLDNISDRLLKMSTKFSPSRLDLIYITYNPLIEKSVATLYKSTDRSLIYYVELSKSSTGKQKWWYDNKFLHAEVSKWLNAVCSRD